MTDQPGTPGDSDVTPSAHVDIRIDRGNPSAEEVAALVAVLAGAGGGPTEPTVPEHNLWGHPADKLRYAVFAWHRVTLLERTHMRR